MVSQAAKVVFNESKKVCDAFGTSMSHALAYCRSKGHKAVTGEKVSKGAMKVYMSFTDKGDDTAAAPTSSSKKAADSSATSDPAGDEDLAAQSGESPRRKIYALRDPPSAAKMTMSTAPLSTVISSQEIAGSATATAAAPSTLGAPKLVSGGSLLFVSKSFCLTNPRATQRFPDDASSSGGASAQEAPPQEEAPP